MSKIVRMEDIINVVGIQNYMQAIQLDIHLLHHLGNEVIGKRQISLMFVYEDYHCSLLMNKEYTIQDFACDCKEYNSDTYCSHCGLLLMYILGNDALVEEALLELNSGYDESFNQYFFSALNTEEEKKEKVSLDVKLIFVHKVYQDSYLYEVQLKIGSKQKYVLKKNIKQFLDHYQMPGQEFVFGKNFTYHSDTCYFDAIDQQLLSFFSIYFASSNFSSYYYTSSTILLNQSQVQTLLELLTNHCFSIEIGYRTLVFDGIDHNFQLPISIKKEKDQTKVILSYEEIEPLTEDFQYIISQKKCYKISKEEASLLRILVGNKKKMIYFKENEMPSFCKVVLPKLRKLDQNIQLDEEMKKELIVAEVHICYYFEMEKDKLMATIKARYQDVTFNVLEETDQLIVRDIEKEHAAQKRLLDCGFILEPYVKKFTLQKEEDIVFFLEETLKGLSEEYETFVSKELKKVRFLRHVVIENQFKIGSDQILSFDFQIDQVNSDEFVSLFEAIKQKKKYYRLKSGDFLHLEEPQWEQMENMLNVLEMQPKDLGKTDFILPKYKSMLLDTLKEDYEFIHFNSGLVSLIEQFKQYKNCDVVFTNEEKNLLRDYQQIGVKWMMTVSKCGFGGILADEMGLGKSLQTIQYMKLKLKENKKSRFLIVVPTSLVYNWQHEFDKFAPTISYLIVHESKAKRQELLKRMEEYQVIVTSYGLLRQDIDLYKEILFDTCIIDEAGSIKNINTDTTRAVKQLNATTKLALTGTPIENSVLELWSIFDFIMPGFLPSLSYFKSLYGKEDSKLEALNKQISPFILRRKKGDVLKDLPAKLENTIMVELSEYQKQIYVSQLEQVKRQIDEAIEKDGFKKSQILILSLLTKLRQICIDPRLLLEEGQMGSKIETLVQVVKDSILNGHKILVFSQFPSALRLVVASFLEEGISYYYLDGQTKSKERIRLVDQFNQNDTNVFLISLKAGGMGLNLTSADIVIHLDPWWNPQVENQATDRAHRIGQKKVVEVVKMITKGTIEEKIVLLQEKKKELSQQVIEGENRDQILLSKLDEKELRKLLS